MRRPSFKRACPRRHCGQNSPAASVAGRCFRLSYRLRRIAALLVLCAARIAGDTELADNGVFRVEPGRLVEESLRPIRFSPHRASAVPVRAGAPRSRARTSTPAPHRFWPTGDVAQTAPREHARPHTARPLSGADILSLSSVRPSFSRLRAACELTLRPAFPPYPAEARVNTRRQPLVVSDPLEEIC